MFGSRFLTMKCIYTPAGVLDPEFRTPTFGQGEEIPCFRYGSKDNLITPDSKDTVSDQRYLVDRHVKPGDLIDGQVVRNVYEYPGFSGNDELYEVTVTVTTDE